MIKTGAHRRYATADAARFTLVSYIRHQLFHRNDIGSFPHGGRSRRAESSIELPNSLFNLGYELRGRFCETKTDPFSYGYKKYPHETNVEIYFEVGSGSKACAL